MTFFRKFWWAIALLLIALVVYCRPKPAAKTSIDMLIYGGFAYIPSGNSLEIAYMKATDHDDCKVTPIGTELQVLEGDIVDAQPNPIPGSKKFDLAGAVVTFPDIENGSSPVAVHPSGRPNIPPVQPADPNNAADWKDLKWVASTA